MKNTIERIKSLVSAYLVALAIVVSCHSILASDEITSSERTVPEILRYSVNGIAEFAAKESDLCNLYPPERTVYVLDLHGVQSRHSYPSGPVAPRGNMPDYTRYKISRGHPVILASAWDDEHKVIEDVKCLGLQEAFKLKGEPEHGVSQFAGSPCKYYKLGNIAALKRLNPPFNPPSYYFQKAFTPLVIYGPECSFDMLIFFDDSGANLDTFLQDVALTPYFSKLKKLVLFQVRTINGANLEIDWITPALLPQEFRTLTYRPEGSVNPLAQAGFYPTNHDEEERPVFILADPPPRYVSPSRSVIPQGEPDPADFGEDSKKSTGMMAVPAPSFRLSSSNPLRQSGYHDRAHFDKHQTAAESPNTSAPKRNPLAQTGFYSFRDSSDEGDNSDEESETPPSDLSSAPESVAASTLPSSTPVVVFIPEAISPDLPAPRVLATSNSLNESLVAVSGSGQTSLLTRSAERCRDEAFYSRVEESQKNSLTKSH